MLKQLSQLTIQADGRYACTEELEFLREYIGSAKSRVKTYQHTREVRGDIAIETSLQLQEHDENIFIVEGKDHRDKFQRDQEISLRYTASTILSGDIERLKQTLLLWLRTIINSSKPPKCRETTGLTCRIKSKIILSKLNPDCHQFVKPALALSQALLS